MPIYGQLSRATETKRTWKTAQYIVPLSYILYHCLYLIENCINKNRLYANIHYLFLFPWQWYIKPNHILCNPYNIFIVLRRSSLMCTYVYDLTKILHFGGLQNTNQMYLGRLIQSVILHRCACIFTKLVARTSGMCTSELIYGSIYAFSRHIMTIFIWSPKTILYLFVSIVWDLYLNKFVNISWAFLHRLNGFWQL